MNVTMRNGIRMYRNVETVENSIGDKAILFFKNGDRKLVDKKDIFIISERSDE